MKKVISFGAFPAEGAPLTVAGHNHGGRISVPGMSEWSYLIYVESDEVHVDGWIEGYGEPGDQIYVNRGIGFSVAPVWIAAMPEVTPFTPRPERA